MRRSYLVLMLALGVFLNGCVLAPVIDSFSSIGLRETDRMKLLAERVKGFHEALYWGKTNESLGYIAEDKRAVVGAELVKTVRTERVVDTRIDYIDYTNDAYSAKVDVVVRYFKVPNYVVTERNEQQEWEFSVSDGWLLKGRKVKS